MLARIKPTGGSAVGIEAMEFVLIAAGVGCVVGIKVMEFIGNPAAIVGIVIVEAMGGAESCVEVGSCGFFSTAAVWAIEDLVSFCFVYDCKTSSMVLVSAVVTRIWIGRRIRRLQCVDFSFSGV